MGDYRNLEGDIEGALSYYKKALEKNPSDKMLRTKYESVYASLLEKNGGRKGTDGAGQKPADDKSTGTDKSDAFSEPAGNVKTSDTGKDTRKNAPGGKVSGASVKGTEDSSAKAEDTSAKVTELVEKGKKAGREKDYGQAEDLFKQARSLDKNFPEINYMVGLAQDNQKKFDEAVGSYQDEISKNPVNAMAYYYLGRIYYKKSLYEKRWKLLTKP